MCPSESAAHCFAASRGAPAPQKIGSLDEGGPGELISQSSGIVADAQPDLYIRRRDAGNRSRANPGARSGSPR